MSRPDPKSFRETGTSFSKIGIFYTVLKTYTKNEDASSCKDTGPGTALSLKRNFAWNLFGNIVYAASQWGMLVVLAKITSPEQVGTFALGLALTAPIFLFSQLQLRGVQATDARSEYQFGHYLGLRLITTGLASVIVGIVACIGCYDTASRMAIMAIACAKAFESIADVYYGLFQRNERMDRIARSRMIKGPVALILLAVLVFCTGNVAAGAFGLAVAWGAILILYDLPNAKKTLRESGRSELSAPIHRPIFTPKPLMRLAWLALPLGIVMALLSWKSNIPRYFIESYTGKAELGIFAALSYFSTAGGLIVNAMGQSITPRLSVYYAKRNISAYVKLLIKAGLISLLFALLSILAAYLFGELLLTVVYGELYSDHVKVFVFLMFVGGVNYLVSIAGHAVTAARLFSIQLPFAVAGVLVTLFCSYVLIPSGLMGAASTLLIGSITILALYLGAIIYATVIKTREYICH